MTFHNRRRICQNKIRSVLLELWYAPVILIVWCKVIRIDVAKKSAVLNAKLEQAHLWWVDRRGGDTWEAPGLCKIMLCD